MKSKMLDYYQHILQAVSFDKALFEKELIKSVKALVLYEEFTDLKQWCLSQFNDSYSSILERVFSEYEWKFTSR
jgi:hypothetical protein